jgi:tripartite-type tricarboxylate transporter receptor subunit TctC
MYRLLAGLFCGLLFSAATPVNAADVYPARPIRFIVPLPPAGAGDIVARTVAAKLSELWGQQVVIDNRGGANTIIGTELAAKAKPDGYTWLLGVQGSLAINPVNYKNLPYDPVRDFDAVTQITRYGYVLIVPPSLPVHTVKELIALGRRRPGELTYSTSGTGGSNHLAGELFRLMSGVEIVPVPYKGSGPGLTALLSGEVSLMFDTLITSMPLLKAGRVRALGVSLQHRSSSLPDVPTIAEAGVPGYRFDAWQSIVVPTGVPKDIINRIYGDVKKILATPDVHERLVVQGANELVGSAPEEFTRAIREDIAKFRKLIADARIVVQ